MSHTATSRQPRPSHRWMAALVATLVVALVFVIVAALPYLGGDVEKLARYDGKRPWLLLHIATGMVALLLGPVQLALGFAWPCSELHRRLGILYLGAIFSSCVPAYYLAIHTELGVTFGFGLAGLATAWVITSSLAMIAVKRRRFLQHQEWMIRSYVVTFAFVIFRMLVVLLTVANVGTPTDRLNVASWFCWSTPLLLCEVIIQGRKLAEPEAGGSGSRPTC